MFSYRKSDSFLFFILIFAVLSRLPVFSKRASPSLDNSLPQLVDDHRLSEIKKIAAAYRRCLLDRVFYEEEIWERIPSAIEACTIGRFWQSIDVHKLKIPDILNEHYYFIPPKPIDSPCVAVRMNIHVDRYGLFPEKTLRQMIPQCEFFGCDEEDIVNFRSIGKFFKKMSSFTEPPDHMFDFGNGIRGSVARDPLYPLMVREKTFLVKYVKRPRIDYLYIHAGIYSQRKKDGTIFIDPNTRYHEFSILQDPINVTVCQLTVEANMFHYADSSGIDQMRYARPKFKPLFLSLLSKTSFLPIRGEFISRSGYLYLFYLNMSDPYCAKKYISICDSDECQDDDFYED